MYLINIHKEDLALNNLHWLIYQIIFIHIYLIYMYKEDLALINLQWLICHKTKPKQTKPNHIYLIHMYKEGLALKDLQWLICHKTKPNQTKPNQNICIYYICIKRVWHWITYNSWNAIKPNQTKSYIFNTYIYKEGLVLNNLQWLICHKTKPTQTKTKQIERRCFTRYPMRSCPC